MGSTRAMSFERRLYREHFVGGGSIWYKQLVVLKAEWNSFLSALSTMSATLGTMEVSCHLNAFYSSLYVDVFLLECCIGLLRA